MNAPVPEAPPDGNAPRTRLSTDGMKLGIFGLNISGGLTLSSAAKSHLDWDENVEVATLADRAGWDFLLPLGRWRGWGGIRNSNSEQYETFMWASALAARTHDIYVFATCHVPIYHPMLAAKLASTVDNVSSGRFGINIVAGWNESEFGMFGLDQLEHDARYAAANEWLDAMEALWSDDADYNLDGRFYTIKNGYLQPKPVQKPRPVILSAGTSSAGLDFALTRADFCFQAGPTWDIVEETAARTQLRSAELESQTKVMTYCSIVVADTEQEAKRYFEWYVDECGDEEGARNMVSEITGGDARSLPADVIKTYTRAFMAGRGLPLVGTADYVADAIVRLHSIGYRGVGLGWLDYRAGFERFDAEVVPLLREAGLRD